MRLLYGFMVEGLATKQWGGNKQRPTQMITIKGSLFRACCSEEVSHNQLTFDRDSKQAKEWKSFILERKGKSPVSLTGGS